MSNDFAIGYAKPVIWACTMAVYCTEADRRSVDRLERYYRMSRTYSQW